MPPLIPGAITILRPPAATRLNRPIPGLTHRTPARHCVRRWHPRQEPRGASPLAAASYAGSPEGACFLGLDFGTSGARCTVIDGDGETVADVKRSYASAGPDGLKTPWHDTWESVLFELTNSLPPAVRQRVASLAVDGTSATALLLDRESGQVLAPAKLYDEAQGAHAVQAAKALAPPTHTATASTSTLCKVLTWHADGAWRDAGSAASASSLCCVLHQADWVASLLHGRRDVSDWNNALKLGFDPGADAYPSWLTDQAFSTWLPATVVAPGAPVATLTAAGALRSGLPSSCLVCGGTTDSVAAFIAAGVTAPGQAVTSLGSTLAVKLLSRQRVDDATYGVYSHRLGDVWLVGGASNTGGAVLRQHFNDDQLRELTEAIDISQPSGLDYYPLTRPGERFPLCDGALEPRLTPRPSDDALFLHGMLEGMAAIEARGYTLLAQLGATPLTQVLTAGGGAANAKWSTLRSRALGGIPVQASTHGEASYGAALLARQGARLHAGGTPLLPLVT